MNINFRILLIFLNMTMFKLCFSQVYQEWISIYDNIPSNISSSRRIQADNLGNIYVLGTNSSDIVLRKYDKQGNMIWLQRYNGTGGGADNPSKLLIDKGYVYAVGSSMGIGTGEDYVTIKYDSSGNQKWVSRYSSPGNYRDAANGIAVDRLNNVYVTGESRSLNGVNRECVTIKYNAKGEQIWIATFSCSIWTWGADIKIDNKNNVFIAGRACNNFLLLKYDSSGIQQFVSFYNGPVNGDDAANRIDLDNEGNIFVAGNSIGEYYWDYALVKFDSIGNELWMRRYNGTANFMDHLADMKIDNKGNVYVTGYATQIGRGYDFTTIKYNTNGDQLWIALYHNGLNDIANALTLDTSGNIYVTGQSDGSGTNFDYATVKYDSSGNQKWVVRYNFSPQHDDEARGIAIDNENNIFVTGVSYVWGSSNSVTIKYNQTTTGIDPTFTQLLSEFILYQNYPNPFNPSTVISYSIPSNVKGEKSEVRMIVYDALGKKISVLVNENKPAGSYTAMFDGSNFSSGIYFYRLEADGKVIDSKRMILLK
jgi:hypothetical protein